MQNTFLVFDPLTLTKGAEMSQEKYRMREKPGFNKRIEKKKKINKKKKKIPVGIKECKFYGVYFLYKPCLYITLKTN